MKILYHHRTQAKGAEGVHIREIVKALEASGNQVFVVSPPGVDIFKDSFDIQGSNKSSKLAKLWNIVSKFFPQVIFEFMEIGYNLLALSNMDKVIKKVKIDYIYERNAFFCWAGVSLARKYKIPIIIEVNEISGIKRVRGQVLKGLAKRMEKDNFLKASAIIVVSAFLKRQISLMGVDEKKIFVVPNGVNPDEFDPGVEKDGKLIDKFGINDKIVLGFVGGFVAWHNFEFLLECFKVIADNCKEVALMLVGDGAKRAEIEASVSRLGLRDKVIFTGNISHREIGGYIQLMDICLIPHSNEYRSPIKLFEYMAMAKAVIAPKLEPIEAVIADNIDGKLFDQNNKDSFIQAVSYLIKDKERRDDISVKARETIMKKYLWQNNAETVIGLYNKLGNND